MARLVIGLVIELVGAVLALGGAIAWARRASGATRALAAIPVGLYVVGQVIPNALAGEDEFASYYRVGLAVMALAGALGAHFLLRRDRPGPS